MLVRLDVYVVGREVGLPEEDVDLLVEYVEGKDTEGIVGLYGSGGAELVEGTLGDSREDLHHRVAPLFLVLPRELYHLRPVCHEGPSEERVNQEHVPYLQQITQLLTTSHFSQLHVGLI